MILRSERENFLQFADQVGMSIKENELQRIKVKFRKNFVFLPELILSFGSYVITKDFMRKSTSNNLKDSICFFFHNVFDDEQTDNKTKAWEETPHVRIFPTRLPQVTRFRKNTNVKIVSVIVSADYLRSFLNQEVEVYQYLFDERHDFLIEEIMTDDILRTVNEIVKKEEPAALKSYHYKLKAMELLFYLFQSLSKRERSLHQKLSENDIKSMYKVRDKLISSLDKPTPISTLKQIAGMNELKMRKFFMQVFGMGIYDYYQRLRMKEAARLLREKKLSVSETGYEMGFENLSHFSRVFEKHIGKKPKKYCAEC